MRNLKYVLLLTMTSILFACVDENIKKPETPLSVTKESLNGFWTYKQVLFNNIDIEVLTPGFSVSNYLHLKEDDTYGKCYILGDWSVEGNSLKLNQHDFSGSPPRYYKIISVTENSLTLEVRLSKSQYGIGVPQFGENEILTVTEIFEK